MQRTATADAAPKKSTASVARDLAESLGIEEFAMNYYELEPGASFATTIHAHPEQEEVFYVLSGTATFDTDEGSIEVGAGEAIRFAPGEFQFGYNDTDRTVAAIALGAPKEAKQGLVECRDCGERGPPRIYRADDGDALVFECRECDGEINRQT